MQLNSKQTNKQTNQKLGRRSKQTCLQRRHTDGQKAHEKKFNVTNYQRNPDQNYNEVPPHTSQNGHYPKYLETINAGEVWRKGNPLTLVGM